MPTTRKGTRIPAKEIEDAVTIRIAEALEDPVSLAVSLDTELDIRGLGALRTAGEVLRARVLAKDAVTIRTLVAAVQFERHEIRIDLQAAELFRILGLGEPRTEIVSLTSLARMSRTGHTMRLIQPDGRAAGEAVPPEKLLKLVLRGRLWWQRLLGGDIDITTIARGEGLTKSYVTRVTRLALLSPKIVDALLAGDQPAKLGSRLLVAPGFPASWTEQEREFLRLQ